MVASKLSTVGDTHIITKDNLFKDCYTELVESLFCILDWHLIVTRSMRENKII